MLRGLVCVGSLLAALGVAGADPYDTLRRKDGTLPAKYDNLDRMHAQIGGAEVWASRGRVGWRLSAMDMVMPLSRDYADHDDVTGIGIEAMVAEVLDIDNGDARNHTRWQG